MFQLAMVIMLHAIENAANSRLRGPEMDQILCVTVYNKGSVLRLLNEYSFAQPHLQDLIIEWEGMTQRLTDAKTIGLWQSAVKNL